MQTTFKDFHRPKTFATDYLPWVITGGALLLFLATLNHWLTISSIGFVAQVGGWTWPANQLTPLAYLATLPFRWLSDTSLPIALNVFTAVLAALALGQLARCIALLPHDRTQPQRDRETSEYSLLTLKGAWLPPLFGALVGGLQSSFWEHSVMATGEMIELVLFAYVVRSLLEFRLDGNNSWAYRAALIYGALMANDWLMIGLLPFFIGALLWMRGVAFFNLRFLMRMAGLGLLGWSLVLLMPWVQSRPDDALATFGEILKANLVAQKNIIVNFQLRQFWVLGLTSLLPLTLVSVRWPSSFGDNSPMGAQIAAFIFHLAHAVFLLVGLWVLFDPPFSPRVILSGASWLPLYFLAVLCLGYFCGYFLLVFGKKPRNRNQSPSQPSFINPLVSGVLLLIVVAAPALLLYKNLAPIRAMNGPLLRTFAQQLLAQLPDRDAVLLSDDATTYALGLAALHLDRPPQQHILLNSRLMIYTPYHRHLKQTYGARLNDNLGASTNLVITDSTQFMALIAQAAETQPVCYLHYSFGYYFEKFLPDPHGFIFQLQPQPADRLAALAPPAATIARNETFWQQLEPTTFPHLTRQVALLNRPRSANPFVRHLNLAPIPDGQAVTLAAIYSRSLDCWAVQLQRAGKLAEARHRFEQAIALNPGNLAAHINLAYNANLATNNTAPITLSRTLDEQLHGYNAWDRFLVANGPVDEPQFCYQQGVVFAQGGLYRQAAEQIERITQLNPDNFSAHLLLANIQNALHFSDDALKSLRTARKLPAAVNAQNELLNAQTTAYYDKNEPKKAELLIETALDDQPKDVALLNSTLQTYLTRGQLTNGLGVIRRLLKLNPDNADALINQSYLHLQLAQYSQAIIGLNHLLDLQPTNAPARLNRAIASLQTGDLATAQTDYESLLAIYPTAYQVSFGLAEIATRKKDSATALKYFSDYLLYAPRDTAEYQAITDRVKTLSTAQP